MLCNELEWNSTLDSLIRAAITPQLLYMIFKIFFIVSNLQEEISFNIDLFLIPFPLRMKSVMLRIGFLTDCFDFRENITSVQL